MPHSLHRSFLLLCVVLPGQVAAQSGRARPVGAPSGPIAFVESDPSGLPTQLEPGTVRRVDKIGGVTPGFEDELDWGDQFGRACARLGDLDGDGVSEIAVGADSSQGGPDVPGGRVWILFPNADGSLKRHQKISATEGGFDGARQGNDGFAWSLSGLGDLDGDGVPDLAVGAPFDQDGEVAGAVWILFLRSDGTVKWQQKISGSEGGFLGTLFSRDSFGAALAHVGDLNQDGFPDLAVGSPAAHGTSNPRFDGEGVLWILFLWPNGRVRGHRKISEANGSLPRGTLNSGDNFGRSLAALGDRNGDGFPDLAVGSRFRNHQPASFESGAVYLLSLGFMGSVVGIREISELEGGFQGDAQNQLAADSIAAIGDLDGDGHDDLAVGNDLNRAENRGLVWILLLNADGTVREQSKVGQGFAGFSGESGGSFGGSIATLGHPQGGGSLELVVGQERDQDDPLPVGGLGWRGAVWILTLTAEGTVVRERKIGGAGGGIPVGTLDPDDAFGASVANLGDLDGDGVHELAVGAPGDDAGGLDRGGVWVLFLDDLRQVRRTQRIGSLDGGFGGVLEDEDAFGSALAVLGDLDGDGIAELAVGAPLDDDGGTDTGAVWVLFPNPDGTLHGWRKISSLQGGFGPALQDRERFGSALASLGDLDGDGRTELAVGAPGSLEAGQFGNGRCFVLSLLPDGTVASTREIASGVGGFVGPLSPRDLFGAALVSPGDVDGDGTDDLVVGVPRDDDGGPETTNVGAVWLLFLRPDGTVRGEQKIGRSEGAFAGALANGVLFGNAVAAPGDLNGDGVPDLAVGVPRHEAAGGFNEGGVWILLLAADGTVQGQLLVDEESGGFVGTLDSQDEFGGQLCADVDLDGDGVRDLLVGALGDDDGGREEGGLWLLELDGIATLDFRRGDDLGLTPLRNGEALLLRGAFRRTVLLSSYGTNAGPAIFDSRPDGPNDSGQDPDLLVGLDHLLVLQNDLASSQTVPGIFDHPNDDENGGTLLLRFQNGAVAPLSLDLVDIDSGTLQSARVTLFDVSGRTREYSIPAAWTGDRVLDGSSGFRTLDLTTSAPQAGFGATATAVEMAGFDPLRVRRVEVLLGSSGAVDNLRWVPHPE